MLIMEVPKAFLCGKLIPISHHRSGEKCNVTFGFKVETTELNILLFPVLNGYVELRNDSPNK